MPCLDVGNADGKPHRSGVRGHQRRGCPDIAPQQLRVRKPYRVVPGLFRFGPLLAFVLCLAVTLGQNYQAFLQDRIDWIGVISTYLAIPLFLALWIGHRLVRKSHWIRYEDMRFYGLDLDRTAGVEASVSTAQNARA